MAAEPFYFGRREHLFGLFHSSTQVRRNHGVVICPPLLNEYMRSHHALRRVALTLADRGYDVLRFDFSGQGNSTGSTAEVTCLDWDDDVGDALAELGSIAAVERMSVVAVRFACSLVARQTGSLRLSHLVCWDPVFDGREWLDMLRRVQRKLRSESRAPDQIGDYEYMGHQTSPAFVKALEQHRYKPSGVENVVVVQTNEGAGVGGHSTMHVPFDCSWEDMSSQVLYSNEVIGALCQTFA
jgi:pimeloyl-ACP methyl ester carboxylesterase